MKTRFKLARIAALGILLAAASPTARALNSETNCTMTLVNCYDSASQLDGFIRRSAAALDCNINYVACVRHALTNW